MSILFSKNLFSLNTRKQTKLFTKNPHFASFEYKFSAFESDKKSANKTCYLNCQCGKSSPFSSPQQHTLRKTVTEATTKASNGIGIVEFFEGKNLLVTGATGFLAKALIEKLLRATPKVNKIYLLIRAKDNGAAFDRLTSEIIESKLFKSLEEMHGESYKSFILGKLIPIAGNVHETNLGMDIVTAHQIAEEIDLIIDSAANTTFDERYDLALEANVNGPCQLMMFAKKCKNLKLLTHHSTAYANGEREGLIYEKPFTMGESITREKVTSISPYTNFPSLHAANELDLVSLFKNAIKNNNGFEQIMKFLGAERAKLHGWHDTYTFTKAMGEMMIDSMREDIPILILRPSVISSCYKEPFPGWIQGFRVIDPLIFLYGKGQLPGVLADPDCLVDVVPVDMVVNATISAIAKHGFMQSPKLSVYHLTSMPMNPLSFSQLMDYTYEYFSSFPFINSKGKEVEIRKMRYFDKISDFSNFIWEDLFRQQYGLKDLSEEEISKSERHFKRKVEYLKQFSKLYEPYSFYKGWFHNGNMQKLMEDMSEEETRSFEIDIGKINWRDYFLKIHILGVQENVFMKGK